MTNLIIKSHKTQLDGSRLSGDTYPIRQWIKTYLNGKWDANSKSWIVDLGLVATWTGTCIRVDDNPVAAKQTGYNKSDYNGICPRCHTYCDGDCTSH
jgi:hypothetical protein